MSLLRALFMVPLIIPTVAIVGLGYMAYASLASAPDEGSTLQDQGQEQAHWRRSVFTSGRNADTIERRDCRAIDGDTLRCGHIRIRLLGVDAAELPGHCAAYRSCAPGDPFAQKAALAALTHGPLTIDEVTIDRWHRQVAQVTMRNGTDLSCAMLAAGATYKPRWDTGYRIARACPSRAIGGL